MMESKNALIIIILVLVISITIFILDRCRKNKQSIENFADGTGGTDIAPAIDPNFMDVPVNSNPNPTRPCNIYYVPENYIFNGQTLDMTYACDMNYFYKFRKQNELIQNDIVTISNKDPNSLTNTEKDILKYGPAVISLKNDPTSVLNTKGKGYCKIDTLGKSGWVELVSDEYNNIYPKKNLANPLISAMGPPESSSFCYKSVGATNDVGNAINSIADCKDTDLVENTSCSIKGMSVAYANPSPLNDNNAYAKIAFKTLNLSNGSGSWYDQRRTGSGGGTVAFEQFDNYNTQELDTTYNYPAGDPNAASILKPCNMTPQILRTGTDIPGNYYIQIDVDNNNIVQAFRFIQYDGGKVNWYPNNSNTPNNKTAIDTTTPEAQNVYNNLFTTIPFGNILYLIPDTFTVTVIKFSNEACDAPNVESANGGTIGYLGFDTVLGSVSTTFSLRDNLRKADNTSALPAQRLYTFDNSLDSTNVGSMSQLTTTLNNLQQQLNQLTPSVPVISNIPGLPANSKAVDIDMSKLYQGIQYTLYDVTGVNNIGGILSTSGLDTAFKTARQKRFGTITTMNMWNNNISSGANTGLILTGVMKIPTSGQYSFVINSENASDCTIVNKISKYNTQNNTQFYVEIPINQVIGNYGMNNMTLPQSPNAQNTGSFTFNADDLVTYTIRVLNSSTDNNLGIQLLWLTPEALQKTNSGGKCTAYTQNPLSANLPNIPAAFSCYVPIPDNVYLYSTQQYEQNNAKLQQATNLNQQIAAIQKAISDLNNQYSKGVLQNIQNIIGARLTFGDSNNRITDLKSNVISPMYIGQGLYRIFVYIGEFETGNINTLTDSIASGVFDVNSPIPIKDMKGNDEFDISNLYNYTLPSPIGTNLVAPDGSLLPVNYTIAFGIKLEQLSSSWRNILYHGKIDNILDNDCTPGIFIAKNSAQLQFVQYSDSSSIEGTQINYNLPLSTYVHITIVVSSVTNATSSYGVMKVYVNGANINGSQNVNDPDPIYYKTPYGTNFTWHSSIGKQLYIHSDKPYRGNTMGDNGQIKLKHVLWYNKALSTREVADLYAPYNTMIDIPKNPPPPITSTGGGANTVDLGPINTAPWASSTNWFIDPRARWIWNLSQDNSKHILNKTITFNNYYYALAPMNVTLYIVASSQATVYVNNMQVGNQVSGGWPGNGSPTQIPISFVAGENDITINAQNTRDVGGLLFTFINNVDGSVLINSSINWSASSSQKDLDDYNATEKATADAAAKAAAVVVNLPLYNKTQLRLKETSSGNYVYFNGTHFLLNGDQNNASVFTVYSDPSVFNNSSGGVGLQITGGPNANSTFARHAGFILWGNGFAGNNYDFSWQFNKIQNTNNQFIIYNWYGGGWYLDVVNGNLQITQNPNKSWIVEIVYLAPTPPASPPQAPFNPQRNYIKTALAGNRCLDISGAGYYNGDPAIIWDCHGGTNQQWTYNPQDKSLRVAHSGKCLDITDHPPWFVQQWDCYGGDRQQWDWNPDTKQITSVHKVNDQTFALNVWGENPNNGTGIFGYDAGQNRDNEHWFVQ